MPTSLSKDHRKLLEKATAAARVLAESACRAALENLAVHEKEYRGHMSVEQRLLRNRLRARGRALGDKRDERSGIQDIRHLSELAAYEHWHRLLFTRFLTENHLLITDEANGSVPVTLEECEELAPELGARDGLDLACRFAGLTLPGVFRRDDPVLDLPIALNDQVELRKLLAAPPFEAFRADDALGWTYQFWQAQRKDEVNKSGKKIGADELSPVTQLFTEDYMVEFLLHNTLGAWWEGKRKYEVGSMNYETEEEARRAASLPPKDGVPGIDWKYLRFVKCTPNGDAASDPSSFIIHNSSFLSWRPAAGAFESWPRSAAAIRMLDPCMGSGHFLVFALPLLVRLRMEEEELSAQAAVVAVLKDNLHGLELDERCTQIAAFNVALTAWKLAGYQALPSLNLACSGLAPSATETEWVALAGDNKRARNGMARLHRLFKDAPILGSLINPRAQGGHLFEADFHELADHLKNALDAESMKDELRIMKEGLGSRKSSGDAVSESCLPHNSSFIIHNSSLELAVIAQGLAKAAELLAGQFTIVITNVPYLGRGKQDDRLKGYCERVHPEAKADLATCFVERCLEFCATDGSTALVTPQNWLFLQTYEKMRTALLRSVSFNAIGRLGPKAFQTPMWDFNVMLIVMTTSQAGTHQRFFGLDAAEPKSVEEKSDVLLRSPIVMPNQLGQIKNPGTSIGFQVIGDQPLLSAFTKVHYGSKPGQTSRVTQCFWEVSASDSARWRFMESTPQKREGYNGKSYVCLSQQEIERQGISEFGIRGADAWGGSGVVLSQMASLPCSLYMGQFFDNNTSVLAPREEAHLEAIWAFVSSSEFPGLVRQRNQKLDVDTGSMVSVPFDLAYWQKVATEKYPDGLPKPHSDDPTQWLFYGHPNPLHPHGMLNRPSNSDGSPFIIHNSSFILHVALARLLGYRWPRQTGSSFPDCPVLGPDGLESFADEDGVVCLPPLNREQPAAARLRSLLVAAFKVAGASCSGDATFDANPELEAPATFDERALIAAAGIKGSKSKTLEDWLRDECFEQHAKLFHDRPFIWHLWDGRSDGFHALINYHRLDHATLQKLTYSYLGNWIQQQSDDARADRPGAAERLGAARALQTKLAAILEGEAPLDIFVRWKPLKDQAQGWHPDLNDGIRQNIRPFLLAGDVGKRGAGLFRTVPLKLKDKDRGAEPTRPKSDYPWFWCEEEPGTDPTGGKDFVGNRWNDVHLTLRRKYEL